MRSMIFALAVEAMGLVVFGATGYGVSEIFFPGLLSSHISVFEVFSVLLFLSVIIALITKQEWFETKEKYNLQKRIFLIGIPMTIFVVSGVSTLSLGMYSVFVISVFITIVAVFLILDLENKKEKGDVDI